MALHPTSYQTPFDPSLSHATLTRLTKILPSCNFDSQLKHAAEGKHLFPYSGGNLVHIFISWSVVVEILTWRV